MTAQATINHDVLRWARERAQMTVDQLARSAQAKPEQVQSLASAAHVPFGIPAYAKGFAVPRIDTFARSPSLQAEFVLPA